MNHHKKIFLILYCCANSLFGQQYFKIPIDGNYYWRQRSVCHDYNYQLNYSKDTIIGGQAYNKYCLFGTTTGTNPCTAHRSYGFIRQDTIAKKVIILDSALVERPLYNFSKVLGDTMLVYNKVLKANVTVTIVNVTTATLSNGSIRKAMWTSSNNCFIEGIGSIFSGLFGSDQPMQSNFNTEELICFGTISPYTMLAEGKTQMDHACNIVGLSDNELLKSQVLIFPNPSTGEFTIKVDNANGMYALKVFNSIGTSIINQKIDFSQDSSFRFKIENKGFYVLALQNEKGTINKKIIVN